MALPSKTPRLEDVLLELDDSENSRLLPKHTTFLCHSGVQKAFVEQLYVDLRSRGHYPFFDQCIESLPKGDVFAERIFEAAKQCKVAVVVLSNEFLMSKWPMLELAAFVEAQATSNPNLKLLPLFYKLEVADLRDTKATIMRMETWKEMAAVDSKINLGAWQNAVTALGRANGEVFSRYGGSEVKYRKAIVDAICKICRPHVESSVPSMVGRERLCHNIEDVFEKMVEHNGGVGGPWKLGMYGTCGIGKTFMCKALCDHFNDDYFGRVCYVDCSNGEYLDLMKLILEELTNVNEKSLRRIKSNEQVDEVLKRFLPKQDIFLALDNVHDGEFDCHFLKYLSTRSKVVVTSRRLVNIQRLLGSTAWYLSTPTLTMLEAFKLFVQIIGCSQSWTKFTNKEMEILKNCIQIGFFESETNGHYNPLVLEAMATVVKHENAMDSIEKLLEKYQRKQNFQQYQRRQLSDILGTNFASLTIEEKQLVIDVALFYPITHLGNVEVVNLIDRVLIWLEIIDGSPRKDILQKLAALEDFNRALDSHKKTYELFPNIRLILNSEGALRVIACDLEGAMIFANKEIDILAMLEESHEDLSFDVLDGKGQIYMARGSLKIRLSHFEGALEDLEISNQLRPDDDFVLTHLGAAKCGVGDFDGATEVLNRAIVLNPTKSSSYTTRALVKIRTNDYAGALKDIKIAFKLEPGCEGAVMLLKHFYPKDGRKPNYSKIAARFMSRLMFSLLKLYLGANTNYCRF